MSKSKLKWALVLSGGGARGIAHIGFLKGLDALGFPKPSLIAGTSMGAIVGGIYACGMSPTEMARFIMEEFQIGDYMDSFVFKLDGPVGHIIQTGQVLASFATKPGMDKGQKALELIEKLTRRKNFNQTKIPFRCNAVDLLSGDEIIFKEGQVAIAIRASMSFPLFFEPVIHNNMYLVDGGIVDNIPVAIARKEGFKHVLAVNVNRFSRDMPRELRSGPQIIYRSIECALRSMQAEQEQKAELTINISNDATPFSFHKKKEFLNLGEKAVKNNLEELEKFFHPVKSILNKKSKGDNK
ncbi:MAG: patatin-like phospholipase family protein [Treponema sp.]|nr:patatin-like phospholipase family protein [Treponema sp.]